MKKFLTACAAALMLAGCGVGNMTVTSGRPDEAYISFTSAQKAPLTVVIDGTTYQVEAVKEKAYRRDRNIKKTALNTIKLTPGAHGVKVMDEAGAVIYEHKVNLGAQEHRVVDVR